MTVLPPKFPQINNPQYSFENFRGFPNLLDKRFKDIPMTLQHIRRFLKRDQYQSWLQPTRYSKLPHLYQRGRRRRWYIILPMILRNKHADCSILLEN